MFLRYVLDFYLVWVALRMLRDGIKTKKARSDNEFYLQFPLFYLLPSSSGLKVKEWNEKYYRGNRKRSADYAIMVGGSVALFFIIEIVLVTIVLLAKEY
ncbi:MAG: hypothetical protein HYZ26_07425 [Chloroflexi bacterium]|nr:hypothetical protein [Chloroflexota bacterium]